MIAAETRFGQPDQGLDSRPDPDLDADQRKVVAHFGGPMLVLAGPGTGKTTTLVEAVLARIRGAGHEPIPASRILVLTFGRRAATQIRQRLALRMGNGILPNVATFHSFAYRVMRGGYGGGHAGGPSSAPRLLTAPEQEHRLREIFANAVKDGRVRWPQELGAALGTRGLAVALRDMISRVQTLALSAGDLAEAAKSGPRVWADLAPFFTEYFDVLAAEGVLDYGELITRAADQVGRLESLFDAIYVDEYQDTDRSQVRLLQQLALPSTTLVAVGDPDQAIYGFRGADVRGVLRFQDDFCGPDGKLARLAVLRHSRRFGPAIRSGAGNVIRRVPLGGLPSQIQRDHRNPSVEVKLACGVETDSVTVVRFSTQAQHAIGVADLVRQARQSGQVARWSQIAVIVRSGAREVGPLRNAMATAGVPVSVVGDDILLRDEPGLWPLLSLLRVAAGVELMSGQTATMLAQSALCGLTADELRGVGRALRAQAIDGRAAVTASAELLAAAVVDRAVLDAVPGEGAKKLAAFADLFEKLRAAIESGSSVPEVLWLAWNHRGEPQRLRSAALAGGVAGMAADRTLDAAMALFDLAGRIDDPLSGARGMGVFLHEVASQHIPGGMDAGSTDSGGLRDCVQLLTAHRAKGLEWDLVVVAGAQEESWPDLRRRPSLFEVDRLTQLATSPYPAPFRHAAGCDLLADERRLFYVACTRARSRLVVTCVAAADETGPQPSRFVAEFAAGAGVDPVDGDRAGVVPDTVAGVVARLRFHLDAAGSSPALRRVVAQRLTALQARLPADQPWLADPDRGWGRRDWTCAPQPLIGVDEPVRVSGSMWTALEACPLAWFLSTHVHADPPTGSQSAFGSVVHAIADAVARGELAADPAILESTVRGAWSAMAFEADWQREAELIEAVAALTRFAQWHEDRSDRQLLASEADFQMEVNTSAGTALVRGRIDRLERSPQGLHVIDLKTQRRPVPAAELSRHRQLALYQLAAGTGVVAGQEDEGEQVLALTAELVQLRLTDSKTGGPRVQTQSQIAPTQVTADLGDIVARMRAEDFAPSKGAACRYCAYCILCPLASTGREVGA